MTFLNMSVDHLYAFEWNHLVDRRHTVLPSKPVPKPASKKHQQLIFSPTDVHPSYVSHAIGIPMLEYQTCALHGWGNVQALTAAEI
jgi:hypothetical protein